MDIKIGGYRIGVEFSDTIIPNNSRVGEYSPIEQVITISNGLTSQHKKETLIHEVLEAINDIYELGLDHDEQLCKLSVILHQVVSDNHSKIIDALSSYE